MATSELHVQADVWQHLLVGVLGLVIGGSSLDLLALNAADHALHFASALLLLGVGLTADRSAGRAHARR